MFGSNKDKNKNNMRTVNSSKSNQTGNIDTLISEACQIEGNLQSKQSIKIDGQILGNIKAEGTVIISSNGRISGDIVAQSLVVYGYIQGNSKTQVIHIQDGGHIEGNIETESLHVEPDATYNGVVAMTKASSGTQQTQLSGVRNAKLENANTNSKSTDQSSHKTKASSSSNENSN